MTRATMPGPANLPPGKIADPLDPNHTAPMFSTAKAQASPAKLVTRRTPVNFGVCCLIDLAQRERAARAVAPGFDSPPPAWGDDVAARHPSA